MNDSQKVPQLSQPSKEMTRLVIHTDGHLGGYARGGDPGTWCPRLWKWAVEEFSIRSVLDVGCGEGHSTRYFKYLGCRVLGVEGCRQALADTVVPGSVTQHDFCDGAFLSPKPFDLIWSCEFLEHVEEKYVPNILRTFEQARKMILVTHAFPGQDRGHHHVNCRPSSYWIKRIEKLGFECHVALTREARTVTLGDDHRINHFARSGLLFLRTEERRSGFWEQVRQAWEARSKVWKIHFGFRMSPAYRHHRRKRRALKRLS